VVGFALFGALLAVAGVQTARSAGVDASSHDSLVAQVNQGRHGLDRARAQLAVVDSHLLKARRDNRAAVTSQQSAEALVARLGTVAGMFPVTGPGLRMVVNDAPGATEDAQFVLDKDLRNIANGLWQAGAEAISINGQRLSTLSSIREAGGIITVNYENVLPPYVVLAIGDPQRLSSRFVESTSGSAWLNAQQTFGLRFDMTDDDSLTIPAVGPERLQLRHATNDQVEGAQ
jgi:uncharacterized protein YlxW (UPF0749 family)